jgi:hypothetical protein
MNCASIWLFIRTSKLFPDLECWAPKCSGLGTYMEFETVSDGKVQGEEGKGGEQNEYFKWEKEADFLC